MGTHSNIHIQIRRISNPLKLVSSDASTFQIRHISDNLKKCYKTGKKVHQVKQVKETGQNFTITIIWNDVSFVAVP